MPRENRKRGKKYKKQAPEPDTIHDHVQDEEVQDEEPQQQAGPSWIVSAAPSARNQADSEAPFGYVDADVKAYFRTVDNQIREWQENGFERPSGGEGGEEDEDPNEERRLFFVAALKEMAGKEKQLATDPDCSTVLERMAYSMDDFVRRVFLDSLTGSYEELVRHRFASHVCQTFFEVIADTVSREARGITPSVPDSPDQGELLTATQLIKEICDELLPSTTSLIMDPFASHVIRALLLPLSPSSSQKPDASVRSKKSAKWKARQGPMKSVFAEDKDKGKQSQEGNKKVIPPDFPVIAMKFVDILKAKLGDNEIRALAADKVASPVLQMLLQVEADQGASEEPGSLMDSVLVGLVTTYKTSPNGLRNIEPSDYINTLLRDSTSSHLFETIVVSSPQPIFDLLWSTYFKGKLARLAVHPVANFVVARAIERLTPEQLGECLKELTDEGVVRKAVKTAKTGVLKSLVDRAAALHDKEKDVVDAICGAFDLNTGDERKQLVPCVLRMKTSKEYNAANAASSKTATNGAEKANGDERSRKWGKKNTAPEEDPMEPKIQGALLIQAILKLSDGQNQVVLDSIESLSVEERLSIAHHPISSRILDVALESPTISATAKRKFIMSFIGNFHLLVDDRIGSRVADRCWALADPYLKEKIARSLVPHDRFLAASYYGKFFARNLHLSLLQRKPEEWKALQSSKNGQAKAVPVQSAKSKKNEKTQQSPAVVDVSQEAGEKQKKRKREGVPGDEIDALFDRTLGKKVKRGALGAESGSGRSNEKSRVKSVTEDKGLNDVLGAIRAAPKDDGDRKKRRTK